MLKAGKTRAIKHQGLCHMRTVVTGQSRETFFQPQFVTSGHVTFTWPRPAGHHTGLFPDHICNNVSSMDRGPINLESNKIYLAVMRYRVGLVSVTSIKSFTTGCLENFGIRNSAVVDLLSKLNMGEESPESRHVFNI